MTNQILEAPVLAVEGLTKVFTRSGYPDFTAADHVSFEVMPGECLGIIGESGSGKSTVVNMVTRLLDATEGRILLDGEDITKVQGKQLRQVYRKVQMVFQTPAESFDPRRTLGDGIGESLRNNGISRKETAEKVEELLVRCGLTPEFAGRYPHEVSGGQCQRAAIARALAIGPKLLICDEATSALDVTIQKEIMELLATLRKERGGGLSILFICHDIALVQQFCDRVLVMYKGKIVEEGVPDEVIQAPRNEYTKRLIESIL
jgi:peptide/nickel transport system ATP-binding protein